MTRASLLAVLMLTACRVHELDDGAYVLAETVGAPLRDDCGLAGTGVLGSATLATSGHLVTLGLSRPPGTLTGTYRYNLEQMMLDGQVSNSEVLVRGQTCRVETMTLHTETQTLDATHFLGTMALSYDARLPDPCACQFWFTYLATRTGP